MRLYVCVCVGGGGTSVCVCDGGTCVCACVCVGGGGMSVCVCVAGYVRLCSFPYARLYTCQVPDIDGTRSLLSLNADRLGHGTCLHSDHGGHDDLVAMVAEQRCPLGEFQSYVSWIPVTVHQRQVF